MVSDGSFDDEGRLVDEELCGGLELTVDGLKPLRLEEACSLPCPGNSQSQVCVRCVSSHTLGKSHQEPNAAESKWFSTFIRSGNTSGAKNTDADFRSVVSFCW